MVARVSRRVGNASKGNMCRPESLPVRARLGTRQKCRGNVRPWNTFKRHSSCRPLHFKHGKGQSHPQKALRACLRWTNERPIAVSQASCPYFPICTRFLMPGEPFSGQNRQNFHRRGAFQAFLCATPGGRRFDAHAGALLYMYVKALTLRYGIWGTSRVIRNGFSFAADSAIPELGAGKLRGDLDAAPRGDTSYRISDSRPVLVPIESDSIALPPCRAATFGR